jgi:hypothetical protein
MGDRQGCPPCKRPGKASGFGDEVAGLLDRTVAIEVHRAGLNGGDLKESACDVMNGSSQILNI